MPAPFYLLNIILAYEIFNNNKYECFLFITILLIDFKSKFNFDVINICIKNV